MCVSAKEKAVIANKNVIRNVNFFIICKI